MSGKYTLTYGRKIRVADYETANIEITVEYDRGETQPDDAWKTQREWVLKRVAEETAAHSKPVERLDGSKQTGPREIQQTPKTKAEQPATPPQLPAKQEAPVGEVEIESIDWLSGPNGDWVYRVNTRGTTDPFIVSLRDYLDSEIARGVKGPVKIGPWLVGYNDPQHVFIGRRRA